MSVQQAPSELLATIVAGHDLSEESAHALMGELMSGTLEPALIGALLAALRSKGESAAEVAGLVRGMLDAATRLPLDAALVDRAVDTCGTGGDGAGTINVSTIAALVVAARGRARHQAREPGGIEPVRERGPARGLGGSRSTSGPTLPQQCSPRSVPRSCSPAATTPRCVTSRRCARRWGCAPCSTCSVRCRTRPACDARSWVCPTRGPVSWSPVRWHGSVTRVHSSCTATTVSTS